MRRITAIRWTQDLRHSMRPQSHPCWTAHYRRGGSKLAGVLLGAIAGLNRFSRGTTPACAVPRRVLASTHRVAARPREGLSATSRHSRGGPRSGVGDKCWADQIGLCFLLRGAVRRPSVLVRIMTARKPAWNAPEAAAGLPRRGGLVGRVRRAAAHLHPDCSTDLPWEFFMSSAHPRLMKSAPHPVGSRALDRAFSEQLEAGSEAQRSPDRCAR
jgi:hypothetical protein